MWKLALAVFASAVLASCGGGNGDGMADPSAMAATPKTEMSAKPKPLPGLLAGDISVANATTAGDQALRTVGATADGGYVVGWYSSAAELAIQAYDSNGAKSGGEIPLAIDVGARTPAAAVQALERASMAVLTDGSVVVLYSVSRDVGIGGGMAQSTTGLSVQHFDGQGVALAPATLVDAVDDLGSKSPFLARAAVLALSDGGFVVAWTVAHYSTVFSAIDTLSLRWFDGNAQPAGSPVQVGSLPEIAFGLAPDDHGGFVLTFVRTDNFYRREFDVEAYDATHAFVEIVPPTLRRTLVMPLGSNYALFQGAGSGATEQLLDAHGNALGAATPVGMVPAAASELADGTYVTVQSAGNGAFTLQWFAPDMAPLGTPLAIDSGRVAPQLAALADPGIAAAWTGAGASSGMDVYTQRFTEKVNSAKKACLNSARQQHLSGAARKAFVAGCTP